jgi:hypothetical protein
MKTVNSLSGGKTSSYIAANYPADYQVFSLVRIEDQDCKFKDKKIRLEVEDRLQLPFIGTAEMDDIVYTMLDLEQYIGQKIDWTSGDTFEQVIKNHGGYLPNKMARYCTTDLKTIPIVKWMYKEIGEPVIMSFGYRANETNRMKSMVDKLDNDGFSNVKVTFEKHKDGRNKWETVRYNKPQFPLIEDRVFKDNIEEFWKGKPVRFAYLNNCVGCHWRSPLLLRHIFTKDPEKMTWFVKQEQQSTGTFRSDVAYEDVSKWNLQFELFDDDFNECDSGHCGL